MRVSILMISKLRFVNPSIKFWFLKIYFFFDQTYKFFIKFRVFSRFLSRLWKRKKTIRKLIPFFKPIFKVNFFLNFNFSLQKKLKYTNYKFYRYVKKVLFFFKRYRNFRKDMFYFVFRRSRYLRLRFKHDNLSSITRNLFYFKRKRRQHYPLINLRFKARLLWKRNREAINYFIKFRASKQYRKTKYFGQFKSKTPHEMFKIFNYNVFSMLYFSNLFYSYHQILYFIKHQFVYKNGLPVRHKYITFSVGDRLNIIFGKRYYFYFMAMHFFFFKQFRKLGRTHWKFIRFRFNLYKQCPQNPDPFFEKYVPHAINHPKFLELDYKSLTVIYLTTNRFSQTLNEFYLRYINYYFFRLYNWKYVI